MKKINKKLKFIPLDIQKFSEPIEAGTTIQVNGNATLTDVDTTKESRVLRLLGQTSQTGTPTPDNPIPVNVVSGDNEINVVGKNLFDFSSTPTLTSSTTCSFTNDTLQVSSTTGGYKRAEWDILDFIKNNPTKVLKFFYASRTDTAGTGTVQMRIKNNGTNTYIQMYMNSYTIPSDTSGITEAVLQVYSNNSNTSQANTLTITNPIIQFGTTQGTYEPYIGKSYPISLGSIELCKIGTYQDYIYKDNGSWYVHKEIGKVVLKGSENWTYASDFSRFSAPYTGNLLATSLLNGTVFSSHYKEGQTSNTNNTISFWTNGSSRQVLVHDERFTTKEQFNEWLSSNNVLCYGILYTPTNTLIEDTTLLEQLEALQST